LEFGTVDYSITGINPQSTETGSHIQYKILKSHVCSEFYSWVASYERCWIAICRYAMWGLWKTNAVGEHGEVNKMQ